MKTSRTPTTISAPSKRRFLQISNAATRQIFHNSFQSSLAVSRNMDLLHPAAILIANEAATRKAKEMTGRGMGK